MGCRQSTPTERRTDGFKDVAAITSRSSFASAYKLEGELGKGTFSTVRLARNKRTGEKVAVKCIDKSSLNQEDEEALMVEVKIMHKLDHPNIVQFKDFFEEKEQYYLVIELLEGGELFDRIVEKEFYTEAEARSLVRTLCEAIGFCHERSIAHRDLKPENILLSSDDENAYIKIADFGFAKPVDSSGLSTACGTPGYVAPEILKAVPYGTSVDMWSIGVITYILLCGYPPFHHENQTKLFRMIKAGSFEFDSPDWDEISDSAKDLINHLLQVDPNKRYTCEQVLKHPWIVGSVPNKQLTTTVTNLKEFNAKRKWKNGINAVRAGVRMKMLLSARGELSP